MLNKKLKARIFEKYGSQVDFSEQLGSDEAVVSRVVRYRRKLSDEDKKRWAKALDCTVQELFGD